jgi:Family of unknown function (DUF6298)/Putative collagen-binding domain of a collagenase
MMKSFFAITALLLLPGIGRGESVSGPLRVSRENPRYFSDSSGKIVYLAGSQSGGWDIQDDTFSGYVALGTRVSFDFKKYLEHTEAQNHNLIRMWSVENTLFDKGPQDQIATPMQFLRTGPGNALDGRPKFDLTRHDPAYFNRLRSAVADAQARGIYVLVMLFEGFGSVHRVGKGYAHPEANPWIGHPFNAQNNINGVNADVNGDGMGTEYHSLASPAVVALQKAYVRKVIDTLNDLDNVLYEIANESIPESKDWQYEMIRTVKQYQSTKPKRHPVVMSMYWPEDSTPALFASPADAVAPGNHYRDNPPASTGEKVVFADQDHNDWNNKDPGYVWKNFLRGNNVILYDPDVIPFDWERGVVRPDDKSREPIRRAVGHTLAYAGRLNLAQMTPQGILSSTAYCLAKPGSEYLVYQPGTGAFMAKLAAGTYAYEWFNPRAGSVASTGSFTTHGENKSFSPPFDGDVILYLKRSTP